MPVELPSMPRASGKSTKTHSPGTSSSMGSPASCVHVSQLPGPRNSAQSEEGHTPPSG